VFGATKLKQKGSKKKKTAGSRVPQTRKKNAVKTRVSLEPITSPNAP